MRKSLEICVYLPGFMVSVFEIPQLSEHAYCQTLLTTPLITSFSVFLCFTLSLVFLIYLASAFNSSTKLSIFWNASLSPSFSMHAYVSDDIWITQMKGRAFYLKDGNIQYCQPTLVHLKWLKKSWCICIYVQCCNEVLWTVKKTTTHTSEEPLTTSTETLF